MNDAREQFESWCTRFGITTLSKRSVTPFLRKQDGVLCLQGKHETSVYPLPMTRELAHTAARIIAERETKRNHAGETRPTI